GAVRVPAERSRSRVDADPAQVPRSHRPVHEARRDGGSRAAPARHLGSGGPLHPARLQVPMVGRLLRTYASFVRISHSVFALPFALVGALLAALERPLTWSRVGWIVAAMVTARSAAMAFNRIADARFDALNPRTAGRE